MDLEHKTEGGMVCIRCGMSAQERAEFHRDTGYHAVCLGYKRTAQTINEWHRKLLKLSANPPRPGG